MTRPLALGERTVCHDPVVDDTCELCEAAPITQRYYEDDLCWVAECEACFVPMVVWKEHDPEPPAEVRVVLLERLAQVMDEHVGWEYFVDDHMRTLPHHYHAHARRRGGWFGR